MTKTKGDEIKKVSCIIDDLKWKTDAGQNHPVKKRSSEDKKGTNRKRSGQDLNVDISDNPVM
jgi:hypothetical protein